MVSVTGIAVGLASQAVIESENVDYWIVPEESSAESVVVGSGGLNLGDVHTTAASLNEDERIDYATPVRLTLVPFEDTQTGEQTYVLAVGVIPAENVEVLGLSTGSMTPDDPYYAAGEYNGKWTGDLVINDAAGTLLNASTGATISSPRATERQFTVTAVSEGDSPSVGGTVPIALMQLSELQSMSGAQAGDQADQILVSTNNRIKDDLEAQYPRTMVVERNGLAAQEVSTSSLPLAIALAALVTALVVGVLFVTTLMGLEVNASRQELGMLAAMGFSRRSRSLIIATETIAIALVGGVLGVGMGALGIAGVNSFGTATLGLDTVARFDPRMFLYALGVAILIGCVGAIYPVLLSLRTTQLEVLSE
ncbi:FtsX-like permease family protein [Halobellus sp. GM3]|uniref:FtsX-like permease family protein n=1 Tax=Halobellus sp. GM3 TaxID=3458410 RepID=UPI00403DF40A